MPPELPSARRVDRAPSGRFVDRAPIRFVDRAGAMLPAAAALAVLSGVAAAATAVLAWQPVAGAIAGSAFVPVAIVVALAVTEPDGRRADLERSRKRSIEGSKGSR